MSKFDNYAGPPFTPYDDCPPDDLCANCLAKLPEDPAEGSTAFEGFCSPQCAAGEPVSCVRPMYDLLCAELGRDDPEGWSRSIYKGTACGAWLVLEGRDAVRVGSIVEGCNADAESFSVVWPFTSEEFWQAVQAVEDSASELWDQTHGCETCARLAGYDCEWGECTGLDGMTPVHPDCDNPECMGTGVAI